MIQRDFILRLIHQAAQALARVLMQKQSGSFEEAQSILAEALRSVSGVTLEKLREASPKELIALCSQGSELSEELAMAVADLLREDATPEGRLRALWLYEAAVDAGGIVPFDVHERIESLRRTTNPPGQSAG